MKILRVSLANLASLAGDAIVDFEDDVLGASPVFAITGRTGAGKSTLLDAICLALYGKTPRYDAGGGTVAVVETRGEVKGDDERNILRRGAGKGWAEVDFLGRDGERYRARWVVRRAHEKPDGALQPVIKELYQLSRPPLPEATSLTPVSQLASGSTPPSAPKGLQPGLTSPPVPEGLQPGLTSPPVPEGRQRLAHPFKGGDQAIENTQSPVGTTEPSGHDVRPTLGAHASPVRDGTDPSPAPAGASAPQPRKRTRKKNASAHADATPDLFSSADPSALADSAIRNPQSAISPDSCLLTPDSCLLASGRDATAEVEKRLGLTFDQFRHAVLLAQGEFKVFLEADVNERSALLEAITGTSVYSRLSIEAHQRRANADARLRELEQALAGIQILSEDERTGLETELAAARAHETDLTRQSQACRAWLDWFALDDQQSAACAEARRQFDELEHALASRAEDFDRLRAWEALEPVRADWTRLGALEADLANSEALQANLLAEQSSQAARQDQLAAAETAARQNAEAARQALEAARPGLALARRLDQACAQARRLAAEAAEAERHADTQLKDAASGLETLEISLNAKQAALEGDRGWLAAREPLRLALEGHEAVCRRLEDLDRQRDELATKKTNLENLQAAQAASGPACEAARAANAAAREQLEHCRAGLERQRDALRALAPDALRDRDRLLQERLALLESAARDQAALERDATALDALARQIAQSSAARDEAAARAAQLEQSRQANDRQARTLRETLERLGQALSRDLSTLRAELQPDQPCPLCGATRHPWAGQGALTALNQELHALRAELQALEETAERLAAAEKEERGRVAGAEGALGQLRRQHGELEARLAETRASLARALEALPPAASPLADQLAAGRREREALAQQLEQLRALEQAVAGLQTRCDQAARDAEACSRALAALEQQCLELAKDAEALAGEGASLTRRHEALLAELRAELGGCPEWVAALAVSSSAPLREALRAEALQYREITRRQRQTEAALNELAARHAAETARIQGLEAQWTRAGELLARRNAELEAAERDRAAVLAGQSADAVEAALEENVHLTQTAHEAARRALEAARQAASELGGKLRALAERLAALHEEASAVRARVAGFAARERLPLDQLAQTLSLDTAWLDAVRQARESLTRRRDLQLGQLEALQRQLESHRASIPPQSREDCEAQRQALEQDQAALKNNLDDLVSRLAIDNQGRARLGAKQQELEAARADALVWQQLGEAIGSADGKKLRAYAQGLTLRALVAHANTHLRQLRPRYALRQNEQAPMDLVLVDRDMGGELRTVRSLSGGESFLVSLALALGLSNMAARDLSIDSLFIDEGFGTLDTDTLQMALAVLQGLHAQGKQVGIISHVEGIAQSLGAEVRVEAVEPGRSRVLVLPAL